MFVLCSFYFVIFSNINCGALTQTKAEAVYNFKAASDEQLDLNCTDQVIVLSRTQLPWLLCQRSSRLDDRGRRLRGLVPASYVEEKRRS